MESFILGVLEEEEGWGFPTLTYTGLFLNIYVKIKIFQGSPTLRFFKMLLVRFAIWMIYVFAVFNSGQVAVITPQQVCCGIGNRRVKIIAVAKHHSLVVTEGGEVFTWGSNRGKWDENRLSF